MVALFEGCLVVGGSHALVEVIDEREAGVVDVFRFLHHAHRPVKVGRETIVEIIRFEKGFLHDKCLMADKHSLTEAFPCKLFGSLQAAHVQKPAVVVHNSSLPIEDIGKFVFGKGVHHLFYCVRRKKGVARVEETKVIACGEGGGFVHRVI